MRMVGWPAVARRDQGGIWSKCWLGLGGGAWAGGAGAFDVCDVGSRHFQSLLRDVITSSSSSTTEEADDE